MDDVSSMKRFDIEISFSEMVGWFVNQCDGAQVGHASCPTHLQFVWYPTKLGYMCVSIFKGLDMS